MKQLNVKTSGSGEALLVLHGWGMNSSVWEPVKAALEARFTVSWIDLPGHGINRHIEADSLDEIVDLLMAAVSKISKINKEPGVKTHLLGWSLGGLIAQAMVRYEAQKFHSLTLVASTPRFSQDTDWHHAMSHEVLDQFSANLQEDFAGTIRRFIGLQFMGIKNSKDLQRSLVKKILQNLPDYSALVLGLKLLKNCDYRDNVNVVPQHWILGGRDRLVPVAVKDELQQRRPDDPLSIINNAGHAPFMTHPQEFMKSVIPFIESHSEPQ